MTTIRSQRKVERPVLEQDNVLRLNANAQVVPAPGTSHALSMSGVMKRQRFARTDALHDSARHPDRAGVQAVACSAWSGYGALSGRGAASRT